MKTTIVLTLALLVSASASARTRTIDRSIRPKPAAAKEIKIRNAETFTLNNGLKVFVVEDRRAPIVHYTLSLDVKPALKGDKAGLNDLFSEVFGNATAKRDKETLNRDIDLIGARLSANSDGGRISVLKKHENKALELLADVLFNPVFDRKEFDLSLERIKSSLASVADDAGAINERVSSALTYGREYPEGEVITEATVANVALDDLRKYYDTYFAPNVSRLVIVGDVTLGEAKKNVQQYFGQWKRKSVSEARYVIPELPARTSVAMVKKAGAVQSSIDVTYPVQFRVGAPDEAAARLMTHILGGGASSRLFANLRERHSYTYGVYNSLTSDELAGRYSLTSGNSAASVKAAATDSALTQIFVELNRMISEPVSDEELRDAKAFLAGEFGRALANASIIAAQAVNIDKYSLPKNYYGTFLQRLEAVTKADVQAAARKYLHPDNALIVVTADESRAESLKKFSADGTVKFYDMDANPIDAASGATSDATADAKPSEIIDKYLEALGGKAAIDRIEDCETVTETTVMGQTMEIRKIVKRPHFFLTTMSVGGSTMQKIVFDGKTVKLIAPGNEREFTEGKEFESLTGEASICPEAEYAAKGVKLKAKGIEKVNGRDARLLEVTKGDHLVVDFFDVETGLKVKTVTSVDTPQGLVQTSVEYGDYRETGGVKFPWTMKTSISGMIIDAKVKTCAVNKGVAEESFK
ncbi:MAG: insulinase family protein [Prevotellaceae bacterium]|jgi:predicted Zn-dependent peptidase|nr:insulinase family protein [Prevotellaceae bacterium]